VLPATAWRQLARAHERACLLKLAHTAATHAHAPHDTRHQDAAEVPFDGTGLDDVFLELAGEFADILDLGPPVQPLWDDSGDCFAPVRAGGKGKK
jgi:hypothetical protein